MIWLLGGTVILATIAFILIWFGVLWLWDKARARYQAGRGRHVAAGPSGERLADTAERESMDKLRQRAYYANRVDVSGPPPTMPRPAPPPGTGAGPAMPVAYPRVYHPPARVPHAVPDVQPANAGGDGCDRCGSPDHRTEGHETVMSILRAPLMDTGQFEAVLTDG